MGASGDALRSGFCPARAGRFRCGRFCEEGKAFLVAKAISPPRAPPLRPRNLLQVVGMCMFIGGAMDSTVLSVVRCADFYSLWTKCGLLGRPVSVVSWDLFCL